MTPPRLMVFAVAMAIAWTLAGCGGADTSMPTTTHHAVCGLVDPDLVAQVLGDTKVHTTGDGAVARSARETSPAGCSITPADAEQPVVQLQIGEVTDSNSFWHDKLAAEAKKAGVQISYTDEPGYGYSVDYTTGMYNPGSSVDVLRGDRIIRVVIYKWSGSTHQQRVAIAEKIVVGADRNLTAFDENQ